MPRFISVEAALLIHHQQIETFGGAYGLRERNALESALGGAEQSHAYTGDLFEAAAQYCIALSRNHPFIDGNKRAAAACMLTFLALNGVKQRYTSAQVFEWTMKAAIGKLKRAGLARLLRAGARKNK